jgi:hypothetical protein
MVIASVVTVTQNYCKTAVFYTAIHRGIKGRLASRDLSSARLYLLLPTECRCERDLSLRDGRTSRSSGTLMWSRWSSRAFSRQEFQNPKPELYCTLSMERFSLVPVRLRSSVVSFFSLKFVLVLRLFLLFAFCNLKSITEVRIDQSHLQRRTKTNDRRHKRAWKEALHASLARVHYVVTAIITNRNR